MQLHLNKDILKPRLHKAVIGRLSKMAVGL